MSKGLAILNELRAKNGKTPLKSWKESKDRLEKTIEREQIEIRAQHRHMIEVETKNKPVKTKHGEVATPKAIKAVRVGTVNVAQIAKELGINPKVARAKLRKANIDRADAAAIRKALTK